MLPSETLPILDPLLLTPIIGQPLYDLLEPDTSILVNLGYGSITEGWNQGPADLVTTVNWGLPDMDWNQVFSALDTGAQQGWDAFTADLSNPATHQMEPLVDSPCERTSPGAGEAVADRAVRESFWHKSHKRLTKRCRSTLPDGVDDEDVYFGSTGNGVGHGAQ